MDLRCFIAIEIPEPIKREVGELINRLKKYNADIKWVIPENLHLTLKFLGDTPEALLPNIEESLFKIVLSYDPFYIKLYGTGVFPNRKHPRVIWIGIEDSKILNKLKLDMEDSMALLGYQKENKEFLAHLTIGRVRSRKGIVYLVNELNNFKDKDFGCIHIKSIKLMKSELKPNGPVYNCLREILFGEKRLS